MVNRLQAPLIHNAVDFSFPLQPCHKTLGTNGLPFYWLKAGAQEVVEITWVFNAGIWHESQTAVAQAVAALLKNGTASKTAFEINEAIEFYGASLRVGANNDYASVTLHCLSKHLPQLLPTIKEIIATAAFDENELEIYKANARHRLAVNLMQNDFVANRHIDAFVYGSTHPYGKFTELKDIDALSAAALRQFHTAHYAFDNCTVFMAGQFPDAALDLLIDIFGKDEWNSHGPVSQIEFARVPNGERVHRIENDPKGVQGAVRLSRDFIMRGHPDFPESVVMNTVFGGYFGSRLMANIREDKGYTYGIHSSMLSYKHAGQLMISTEAGREVCEATVAEIYKEMDRMRREPVGEEELLLVKNYLLGNLLGDLDGPFSIMQRWKNLILNHQGEEEFHKAVAIYKNVRPERIQELAERYLQPDAFFELIVV